MFEVNNNPRLPAFLEGVNLGRKVESAGFLSEHRRALAGVAANDVRPPNLTGQGGVGVGIAAVDQLHELTGAPPLAGEGAIAPAAPVAPAPIDMSRIEAAIDRLRLLSERLAAEARSDALEVGLMIARKVVEGELAVNADRLIGVVKSAISRVGESRRIVVHLAPEDIAFLNRPLAGGPAAGAAAAEGTAEAQPAPSVSPLERLGRGAAKVEVLADASLSRGDCVVEGDHLSVDARLDAKFAEIRRALLESAWEDEA